MRCSCSLTVYGQANDVNILFPGSILVTAVVTSVVIVFIIITIFMVCDNELPEFARQTPNMVGMYSKMCRALNCDARGLIVCG